MSELFYSMRQTEAIIEHAIMNPLQHSRVAPFIEGPPGIGKTALMKAITRRHWRTKENPTGFNKLVIFVAPERDVMEFGTPMLNADKTAIRMMPLDDMVFEKDDRVCFMIDEIDKAQNQMQNVLGRVSHDHEVFNVKLPDNSFVLMAGNRLTDRVGAFAANNHIKGRRRRIPAGVNADEWLDYVAPNENCHPAVRSYIRTSKDMLHVFQPDTPTGGTSPRQWSKVGEQLWFPMDPIVERATIEGDIGVEAANAFWGHLQIYRDLRDPEEIIKRPSNIPLPAGDNKLAVTWAEVCRLADYAEEKNADQIFTYFNRLDGEFAFCGYKDVLAKDKRDRNNKLPGKRVMSSKHGMFWMTKHADLIAATNKD